MLIFTSPTLAATNEQNSSNILINIFNKEVSMFPELHIKLTKQLIPYIKDFKISPTSEEVATQATVKISYETVVKNISTLDEFIRQSFSDVEIEHVTGLYIIYKVKTKNNSKLCNLLSTFIEQYKTVFANLGKLEIELDLNVSTNKQNIQPLYATTNVLKAIVAKQSISNYTLLILDYKYAHINNLELLVYDCIKNRKLCIYLLGYQNLDFDIFATNISLRLREQGIFLSDTKIRSYIQDGGTTGDAGIYLHN